MKKFSNTEAELEKVWLIKKRAFSNTCFTFKQMLHMALQPAIRCSKLTVETLEQGVKYVQS